MNSENIQVEEVTENLIKDVPVLPLRNLVALPNSVLHIDIGRKGSIAAVKMALNNGKRLFLSAQKDPVKENVTDTDIYSVGTIGIVKMIKENGPDDCRATIECVSRARLASGFFRVKDAAVADIEYIVEEYVDEAVSKKAAAGLRTVRTAFTALEGFMDSIPSDLRLFILTSPDAGGVCDRIAANLPLRFTDKQKILEEKDVCKRLQALSVILFKEIDICKTEASMMTKINDQLNKHHKEIFLREQLRAIKEELGEEDPYFEDDSDIIEQIEKKKLPKAVKDALLKEAKRYYKLPQGSQEAAVSRDYIDTCLDLPWGVFDKETPDIEKAKAVLEKDHYGLEKVKDRILETIAVKQKNPQNKGQILCLIGPPGTGKTSIAQSVAKALGRKFVRISLGGIDDEAEIRGHRRTYVGSMPGKIISAIREAKTSNPLILLDEIDKLSSSHKGDPASALLEVLDPEQNKTFKDHYIDLAYDLSDVFFITTANDSSTIPAPLWDRMDVIELTSYTYDEKLQIAKKHLLPKQLKKHGLKASEVKITPSALNAIIMSYTREAGVRGLEKNIASLCRKATKKLLETNCEKVTITDKNIHEYLGARKVSQDKIPDKDRVGVVTGLAYTTVGGEIMPLEVNVMEGTGKTELTGSLGDVMKESAKAAISFIRANADELGVSPTFYKDKDIHIHAPEGAVPKDGPSAGCAMATALYSQLSNKPIKREIAMTGEITIRGNVLAIGGLREKTMAAYKAGVKTVIMPKENEKDIEEISDIVKKNVEFVYAENVKDVFKYAFR